MDPKLEAAKGQAEEATGALTENDDLKAQGHADQASAKVRQTIDDAAEKAKSTVTGLADKAVWAIDALSGKRS